MREESNVNVQRQAFKERRRGPFVLQDTFDEPWWRKVFTWEILTVAGRELKGFVVPQWAAGVLLATVVSAFAFMYQQNAASREMLIRLDQKLSDKADHDQEYRIEMKNRFDSVEAWQQVTNKNLGNLETRLEEALKPKRGGKG